MVITYVNERFVKDVYAEKVVLFGFKPHGD